MYNNSSVSFYLNELTRKKYLKIAIWLFKFIEFYLNQFKLRINVDNLVIVKKFTIQLNYLIRFHLF